MPSCSIGILPMNFFFYLLKSTVSICIPILFKLNNIPLIYLLSVLVEESGELHDYWVIYSSKSRNIGSSVIIKPIKNTKSWCHFALVCPSSKFYLSIFHNSYLVQQRLPQYLFHRFDTLIFRLQQ